MKNLRFISVATVALFLGSLTLQGTVPVKKTVSQFLSMSKSDTTVCELTGVVSRIRNKDFNRLFIKDRTGTVLIYGFSDAQGRGIMALDIRKGDTLTVQGRRYVYNRSVIEMKGARYIRHSEGPDHANVPAANELDKNPTFKGSEGLDKFSQWVHQNLVYPTEAKDPSVDRKVVVQFVVGTNGSVQEVQIVRGSHPALNEEAMRVIRKSPKWKPGMVDGHAVRCTYQIPVVFPENK